MQYQLRDGLSFCFVDGHPIFIDLRSDRYFMLSRALERTFASYIHGCTSRTEPMSGLLELGILVPAGLPQTPPGSSIETAIRSAMEEQTSPHRLSAHAYVEVLSIAYRIRSRLRTMSLHTLLNDLAIYRKSRFSLAHAFSPQSMETDTMAAANQFRHTRNWVPLGTSCLLDSLSLVTYLANRNLWANIVFGVTLAPFSAHCWAQFRDIALNETVTGAGAHTTILVW